MSSTEGEFFRVHAGPQIAYGGGIGWVKFAENPQPIDEDGRRSAFCRLDLVHKKEQAAVYPELGAAAILSVLRTTYPGAGLEPATFDEWISATAGPGQ